MRCLSCREEYEYEEANAGTCKECYVEASETEEELKREIDDLKSKLKFLTTRSPVDPHNPNNSSSSLFTDVLLFASDEDYCGDGAPSVPAHKAVLVSRSPVFRAMLKNEMEESRSGTIRISDVSYEVLCSFVHYLYTAEVTLDEQMACELLALAEKYQVKHLKAYSQCDHLLEASLLVVTDNMDKLTKQDVYKELIDKDPRLIVGIYEAYLAKKDNTASSCSLPQNPS
ncbi:hypothetical protein Syun_003373 [Stephania yunnanensis]|uniref:BTB domain-containing protein n=1 Tax=Stephania yunnanensis TaxID=152371 RepID=A0AAP0L177_9MAGN